MATPNGLNPTFDTVTTTSQTLSPDAVAGAKIRPGVDKVRLAANVNGVTDFTVLPSLASVPNGHKITIIAGAANSELRTPAGSLEEINSANADGPEEALLTAGNVYELIKIDNTIGWMLRSFTALGVVVGAVVPD